jgi:hypothetical protein
MPGITVAILFKMSCQHKLVALSIRFRACERKVNYKLSAVCIPIAAKLIRVANTMCGVGISITSCQFKIYTP